MTYPALIGATLIFGLTASAEDTSFKKTRLSSPTDLKSVPVNLTITKSGISIHTKAGSAADVELPFSTVSRISYGTKDRRRLLEGAIIAPVLAATKAQSHWLVIECSPDGVPRSVVLQLHKAEFRDVISSLNMQSGRRVEALEDPTTGSQNIDEVLPLRLDEVMPAIEPAMRSMGCDIRKRKKNGVECYRSHEHAGQAGTSGETVSAFVEANGSGTRIRIKTSHGLFGRNWSTPMYRELRKQLELPEVPTTGRH